MTYDPREPGVIRSGGNYLIRLPYWEPLRESLRLIGKWNAIEKAWVVPLSETEELDEILAEYGLGRSQQIEELHQLIEHLTEKVERSAPKVINDPFRQLFLTMPRDRRQSTYRALAKILHPDAGGDGRVMTALNRAYDHARSR